MSYIIEKGTNDIVISGWENGIADDPYAGISDIRNVNLISIPKEGSVNFSTQKNSPAQASGTVVSANAGADTVLLTGYSNLVDLQAIVFSGGSLPAGISAGSVYWVSNATGGNYQLYSDWALNSLVNITGTGTGTWATVDMAIPQYFSHYVNIYIDGYFMIDSAGKIWTNILTGSAGVWRFFAGTGGTGNGLVSYQPSNSGLAGTGYLFAFKQYEIWYYKIVKTTGAYNVTVHQGWNPATGTDGNSNYLKCYTTLNGTIHESLVGPDNKVYYCDSNWIGRFYQKDPNVPFDPSSTSTYVFDQTAVLPFTDRAQCLAFLSNTLLIGGVNNVIYPWDTFSQTPNYPIFIAESNVQKLVTVNTNTFALVGNRGRIYYTNGSQATLFKKIPDHLSGTVEPYFTWGGLTSNKNQIYFSASVTSNSGSAINQYGGVWAIDVDTKAIRLVNKLSYGTYAGYANCIIPNFSTNPAGAGLYIGWNNGVSVNAPNNGIDVTISTPYTGGEATIAGDLIPIGTVLEPTTNGRVEFKLAVPIVSGESVKLQYRQKFSDSFTDIDSNVLFNYTTSQNGGWNGYSGAYQSVNFEKSQWIQIQAVLTSTGSSPSYCRLTEIRLGKG